MKKYIIISLAALFALVACTKEHASNQKITYYPELILIGGEEVLWELGQAWEDPGFTAIMAGADASDKVVVTGSVDVSKTGPNYISYSLVNEDGFESSSQRTVYVFNPKTKLDISGEYAVDPLLSKNGSKTFKDACEARKASYPDTYGKYATTDITITFEQIAPGFYYVDDLFAGWYHSIQGRGGYYQAMYGPDYLTYFDMQSYVYCDDAGTITLGGSYIPCWGDGFDWIKNGKYDNGTISYSASYAKQIFVDPVMNKK